jgi:aminopeptidase N
MCRDGEIAARDYVRLVLSGVSSIADISVVQTLLRQASVAVRRYVDPAWRATGLELMANSLRPLTLEAAAGSDAQLAYVRTFVGVATSSEDLAFLAGLLDGSVVLDGLTVDTDLRWTLLVQLVSRGVLGVAEIDAELAKDPTDAGERHAATCRAAIPAVPAKRAAWEALVGGELPLAVFRAVLAGFVDLDHPELMEPYCPEYFGAIGKVWQDWSSAMAQDFVSGLYGVCPLSTETVAATDAYIATAQSSSAQSSSAGPPPALTRLLTEGRDDVLRALRCQARDRQAQ